MGEWCEAMVFSGIFWAALTKRKKQKKKTHSKQVGVSVSLFLLFRFEGFGSRGLVFWRRLEKKMSFFESVGVKLSM